MAHFAFRSQALEQTTHVVLVVDAVGAEELLHPLFHALLEQ